MRFRQAILISVMSLLVFRCSNLFDADDATYQVSGYLAYTGQPLEGAEVTIDQQINYQTYTNTDGYFEINNVPEGSHTLSVVKTFEQGSFSELSSTFTLNNDLVLEALRLPKAVELRAPENVTESSMQLIWTQTDAEDFREYKLYSHTTSGLDENTGTLVHVSTARNDTSFIDTDLSHFSTYYYRVYVMNDYGRMGGSNIVSDTTEQINLVWNGDFEDSTDLSSWWNTIIAETAEYSDSLKVSGKYSLHLIPDTTKDSSGWIAGGRIWKSISPVNFPFEAGRTYKLSGWIKTTGVVVGWPAPAWDFGVAALFLETWNDLWVGIKIGDNTDWSYRDTDWIYVEQTFVCPTFQGNTFSGWLHIGTVCENAWFDNIRLEVIN